MDNAAPKLTFETTGIKISVKNNTNSSILIEYKDDVDLRTIHKDLQKSIKDLQKSVDVVELAVRLNDATKANRTGGVLATLRGLESMGIGDCDCDDCFPGFIRSQIKESILTFSDQKLALDTAPNLVSKLRDNEIALYMV